MNKKSVQDLISEKYEIILGSSSPRRYEIMHDMMGFSHITVMKPSFEENLPKENYKSDISGYALETSRFKAEGLLSDLTEKRGHDFSGDTKAQKFLIICADTVVADRDNNIYEKPVTKENQERYLRKFCYEIGGRCDFVRVITGVSIVVWSGNWETCKRTSFTEESKVFFDGNTPEKLIKQYVETGDGLQVAGGFKIQGSSGVFIKKIDGDYFNVVGMPLNKTFMKIIECYEEQCSNI